MTVTFEEYQAAKNEIIGGEEYVEETQFPNQWNVSSKQYHTSGNGTFYEVTDPDTGRIEFWSDKHSESRYYNSRENSIKPEQQPPVQAQEKAQALARGRDKSNFFCVDVCELRDFDILKGEELETLIKIAEKIEIFKKGYKYGKDNT